MGTIAAAEAAKSSSSSLTFPILIVLVFVGFYFLMIRPQRRRQQQVAQQQRTVNPGARVRTTAGMYATVVAVDGDDETSGTHDATHGVGSGEEGRADSHDKMAKSDKDNVF
jgi:preprotein translocase YajC subunit